MIVQIYIKVEKVSLFIFSALTSTLDVLSKAMIKSGNFQIVSKRKVINRVKAQIDLETIGPA